MRFSHILQIIFCLIVLSGCGSSKKAVTPSSGAISGKVSFAEVVGNSPKWNDVEVPINVRISSPINFNISGRAKMIRGKIVDISLRMLGFEVGRIYLDSDSVFGYIKTSKMCIAESLGDLTAQIPVNISNIQDLLTGVLFIVGNKSLSGADKKYFSIEPENGGAMMIPNKQPNQFQYGFFVDDENHVSRFVGGNNAKNIQFMGDYSDYYSSLNMAGDIDVTVTLNRPIIASINWRWESAKWNKGISEGFSMPRGYKRVKSQQLLNNLPK